MKICDDSGWDGAPFLQLFFIRFEANPSEYGSYLLRNYSYTSENSLADIRRLANSHYVLHQIILERLSQVLGLNL
jgi:hypothetical protein